MRFGGVLAVDDVSFEVRRGEVFTLIGPNGAGKTTVFNLIGRIYTPTSGSIEFDGQPLLSRAPHEIAGLGIARTFQNIELFEHATRAAEPAHRPPHPHRSTGVVSDLPFMPGVRDAERRTRAQGRARDRPARPAALPLMTLVAGLLPYGVRKVVELARALCTEAASCCCSTSRRPA